MMRIGIFPAIAGRRGGGVETFELNLVRSLAQAAPQDEFRVFCLSQAAADSFAPSPNVHCQVVWPALRWISYPLTLPRAIAHSGVDVVHATFVPPMRCSVPLVMSIHDICIHTHPASYPMAIRRRFSALLFKRVRSFTHVICPTHTTRNLLLEHFDTDESRVSVVPYGVDRDFCLVPAADVAAVLERYSIPQPYVLFSGNLRVEGKNLIRLLEAFHQFRGARSDDIKLVFTGRRSWGSEKLDETIARLNLRNAIIEPGWVPPECVPAFYAGASMVLLPSLCEGFGLPALEAMACGTPVITSNLSCMPEVVGDAALLVDPFSVQDMAATMGRLFDDAQLQAQLRLRGLEWVKQYSWERTARETLKVYSQLISR